MAHLQLGFALTLFLFIQGCRSQAPSCGVAPSNNRIVGGQDAVPDAWPWQALLFLDDSFTCGGSLISEDWVLTAAHCITSNDLFRAEVKLGINDQSGMNPNEQIRDLDDIICHPNYDSSTFDNDICLLKLSQPVSITPVCLPTEESTFHTGLSSWVTGFGTTDSGFLADVLQEVNVPIVGNNKCECYNPFYISENMICAGLKRGGNDSCQGDSGGPLMTKRADDSWLQMGVVSFGEGCGLPNRPGVYARVSRYEDWITATVNGSDVTFVDFISPGSDPDANFVCPTSPPTTPFWPFPTDDSIFGGADDLIHFTHFFSVCVFGLLVHALFGGGAM